MKLCHRFALAIALITSPVYALAQNPPSPAPAPSPAPLRVSSSSSYVVTPEGRPRTGDQPRVVTINVIPKLVKATYLGANVAPSGQALQAQLKLPQGVGLVVSGVDAGSPASAGGLKENDVITRLDDQFVINAQQFEVLVRMHKPGEKVEITVMREAQPVKLSATLVQKERPDLLWITSEPLGNSYTQPEVKLNSTSTYQGEISGPLQVNGATMTFRAVPATQPATHPADNLP